MGISSIEVKKINRSNILHYMLHAKNVFSKNQIANALNLSIPTVTQSLKELQTYGLVKEAGALESVGGRKAMSYQCKKNAKVAIGVDITPNHVNIVISNLAGEPLYAERRKVKTYEELRLLIEKSIEKNRLHEENILGIGLSLPAIINKCGSKIIAIHEKMKTWTNLYENLKSWFSFPIVMVNDANSAARAELSVNPCEQEFIYFSISQSVGGALIHSQDLIEGRNQRAGEFGHMTLIADGKRCYCGRKGCVDAYCSTTILSNMADGKLDDFFNRLSSGDAKCSQVWNDYIKYLALALHNLNMVFDTQIIVGGYLGQYVGKYMDQLTALIKEMDPYINDFSFIKTAALKYEASAVGAAIYFAEQYISSI